ncbi:folate-binding protein [Gleimia sp. 6138-11-ORH1]|uniref:CAF17-like 4Fe-4S cluster assembly/insertion protein YgfZ n=1 Tax=Gleimia sp. 6138-11-ORH1 TaxID=2973937 RepID=UPI002166CBC0|nr:glycine cleavage T C-terminal barrel domain-containing protein [Gleimia sp. 6138-11-ORH1]MCS4484687.1 folate-binding protein [Gleimia sp. 6138-11-ORH1]
MSEQAVTAGIPGAVLDAEQPLAVHHYGDLSGEQWALEAGRALRDFSSLAVVQVCGVDRLSWLTTLSSQILTDLQPGQSRELLLLDPQGRIQFACAAMDDGSQLLLLLEGAKTTALVEFLKRMQFMLRVEVKDVSKNFQVVATVCSTAKLPRLRESLLALPGATFTWVDPWPEVTPGGATYTPVDFIHPATHRRRLFVLVNAAEFAQFKQGWDELPTTSKDCPWAGSNAWEALRIEDLRPAFASEVDSKALPHELDWLRTAVHLQKGCYCGQEAVARIVNLGKPPRRLVLLQLDGSQSVQVKPGAAVQAGKRVVGAVTSVARHADLGPIALALVKRGIGLEIPLEVVQGEETVPALQEVIVSVEGKSSASPAQRPGSELRGVNLRKREE